MIQQDKKGGKESLESSNEKEKMDSNDYLRIVINNAPNSLHPLDMRRFARYAISCIKENKLIDANALREGRVSEDVIDMFQSAYSWIKVAMDVLPEMEEQNE